MKFGPVFRELLKTDIKTNTPILITGKSGIGKSDTVKDVAKDLGTKLFVLPCNTLNTKEDLTGVRTMPVEGKPGEFSQVFIPHDAVLQAILYAEEHPDETPLLDLQEINRTEPGTTSSILTLNTERVLGRKKLPDNLRLIASGNIEGNIALFDAASLSRFVVYRMEADAKTWLDYMGDKTHPFIADILNKNPELIYEESHSGMFAGNSSDEDEESDADFDALYDTTEELKQICTPRTLEMLNRWLKVVDADTLRMLFDEPSSLTENETLLHERIHGFIGRGQFSNLLIDKIIQSFNVVNTAAFSPQAPVISKPKEVDQLTACNTKTELENWINSYNDKQLSSILNYYLSDNAPYSPNIIDIISEKIVNIDKESLSIIFGYAVNQGKFNKQNIEHLQSTNTPLANNLDVLFSLIP